jgi:hypothetical protein
VVDTTCHAFQNRLGAKLPLGLAGMANIYFLCNRLFFFCNKDVRLDDVVGAQLPLSLQVFFSRSPEALPAQDVMGLHILCFGRGDRALNQI